MRASLMRAVGGKEGQQVDACIRDSNNTGLYIYLTYMYMRRQFFFFFSGEDR